MVAEADGDNAEPAARRAHAPGRGQHEAVAELTGLEGMTPQLQDVFRFERRGRKGKAVLGEFVATGIVPRLVGGLREQDVDVPLALFRKPGGRTDG